MLQLEQKPWDVACASMLAQGREAVKTLLKDNPALLATIEHQISTHLHPSESVAQDSQPVQHEEVEES